MLSISSPSNRQVDLPYHLPSVLDAQVQAPLPADVDSSSQGHQERTDEEEFGVGLQFADCIGDGHGRKDVAARSASADEYFHIF